MIRLRPSRRPYGRWTLALALVAAVRAPAHGQDAPPPLQVPVDCAMGRHCVVQNYVDHGPGTAAQDLRCGHLTYDGHDGTDIRVATLAEMAAGVPVVAAAAGEVVALRDGMPDAFLDEIDAARLKDRDAGNGVLIDHGDGWRTQYSHLKRGSVRVRRGQEVTAGTVLGEIGLSGRTEFPHVEFTLRHEGQPVDPYTGRAPGAGCRSGGGPGFWRESARARLPYQAGGLLKTGFANGAVTVREVVGARLDGTAPARDGPALVFWVLTFGVQAGDIEILRLTGPDGRALGELRKTIPGDKAQWLRFAGKRAGDGPWPAGTYTGTYTLVRQTNGQTRTVIETRETLRLGTASE